MERVNGALLVLPCRVYRLTEYEVPGCRPMERNSKKIEFFNSHFSFPCLKADSRRRLSITREREGACVSWDVPADGGTRASTRSGFNEETTHGIPE